MKFFKNLIGISLLAFAAVMPGQASADVINVGTSGNRDCTFGCVARYQQVYSSTLFGDSPVNIAEVNFFASQFFINGSRSFTMSLSSRA